MRTPHLPSYLHFYVGILLRCICPINAAGMVPSGRNMASITLSCPATLYSTIDIQKYPSSKSHSNSSKIPCSAAAAYGVCICRFLVGGGGGGAHFYITYRRL